MLKRHRNCKIIKRSATAETFTNLVNCIINHTPDVQFIYGSLGKILVTGDELSGTVGIKACIRGQRRNHGCLESLPVVVLFYVDLDTKTKHWNIEQELPIKPNTTPVWIDPLIMKYDAVEKTKAFALTQN